MPLQKISEKSQATRISYTSTTLYATVISRLEKEFLSRPASTHSDLSFLLATPPSETLNAEVFKSNVRAAAGPHGFLQLHAFNHGDLLAMHGLNGGRGLQRIFVGNPMTAIDVLSRDLRVGLSAPVDILNIENEGGGTSVVWQDPLYRDDGVEQRCGVSAKCYKVGEWVRDGCHCRVGGLRLAMKGLQ